MKNLFYPLLFATALVSIACSNDLESDGDVIDPSNKTAISFVGEDNSAARTRAGFADATLIAMHIRSTNALDTSKILETRTYANALKDAAQSPVSNSDIQAPSDDNVCYWDDAYGRDAQLSVFAVAVPKTTTVTNNGKTLVNLLTGSRAWSTGKLSESIEWHVSPDQSGTSTVIPDLTTIDAEDLTYSNNISKDGTGGAKSYNYTATDYTDVNNGYLMFRLKDNTITDGPGKFDQGNLKFNHALSRITVTLEKGTGYGEGSFKFPVDDEGKVTSNVKVLGVPISGDLDIENGSWKNVKTAEITKMYTTETTSSAACTLKAQLLPGYVITDGNDKDNVLEFIIDDNKYFITQDMMFDALKGKDGITESTTSTITMEKGRNYVFNIKVGKSKIINVTATLEPWTDVNAEKQTMDNSHITLSLFTNSDGSACDNFDLYRLNDESTNISTETRDDAKNWGGNYTDKAEKEKKNGKWETSWYFENNKAFYHFRTVNAGTDIKEKNTDKDDYFEIYSGAQDTHDYHWGAPFVKGTTSPIAYSTTEGYAASLSPAIGATNSTINITELHMMSNINVVLRTTKDTSSEHVVLEKTETNGSTTTTKQCEVSLTYFYANGQVKMGNGLVSTTGGLSNSVPFYAPEAGIDKTSDAKYNSTGAFTFAVVPQALVRSTGEHLYVGITIKTPDNNQYYVVEKLSEIIASANGGSQNQTANSAVTFWYPNHKYTYTFILTKTGIKNVTCTVEKWTDVTAKEQTITLEN